MTEKQLKKLGFKLVMWATYEKDGLFILFGYDEDHEGAWGNHNAKWYKIDNKKQLELFKRICNVA